MERKAIIVLIAFLLLSGGALTALFMAGCSSNTAQTETTTAAAARSSTAPAAIKPALSNAPAASTQPLAGTTTKSDNSGNYQPTATTGPNPGPAPAGAAGLPNLSCLLTAETNPDNSISLLFYVQGPGFFTVQENVSDTWQTTKQNVFYSGTGGLQAGSLPAGADSVTLRLLKIENGAFTSVSSDFTVRRQDVNSAGGLKTYRG